MLRPDPVSPGQHPVHCLVSHDSLKIIDPPPKLLYRNQYNPSIAFLSLGDESTFFPSHFGFRFYYHTETSFGKSGDLGIGEVESVSSHRISDSRGLAFTLSGKGLDAMDGQRMVLAAGSETHALWGLLERGFVPLLDCVSGDWTPTESRAVYGALRGRTQDESARSWPPDRKTGKQLTRQAVGDSLMRAHWGTVEAVLLWAEKEIKQALKLVHG